MSRTIERTSLDLRYENHRLRNMATEARLLGSIAERGIEQPLAGVDTAQGPVLLDGFKRVRCARQLGIESVPYVSWGNDEAQGIAHLMSVGNRRGLNILEEARFVTELLTIHGMTSADVAETLSRSKAWVSVRRGLIQEMSSVVQDIMFRGAFPVYAYMSALRPFMRMNGVGSLEVEQFVQSIASQKLSLREIELLADGYFRGPAGLREAIREGRWKWTLQQLQEVPEDPSACNAVEQSLLRDLEQLLKSMERITLRAHDTRLETRAFLAQAHLLVASLLGRRDSFLQILEVLYDRCGRTECDSAIASERNGIQRDQSQPTSQPQHRAVDCQTSGEDHAEAEMR